MNKKTFILSILLALGMSATQAAQRDYYAVEWSNGSVHSAYNYVSFTLQDVVTSIQNNGMGLAYPTPYTCTGWSTYYNSGTRPIAEGTLSYWQFDPNGVVYAVPLTMWGCTKRYQTPPEMPDQYFYDKPASHVVCNSGFAVSTTTVTGGEASRCVPDSSAQQTAHNTNQQGVPTNCDACKTFRGDPVNVTNGNELMAESDYSGAGGNLLSFSRTYNSGTGFSSVSFGNGWTHNFDYRALIEYSTAATIVLVRPDGSSILFTRNGNAYVGETPDQGAISATFAGSGISNFTYRRPDGTQEQYNNVGQLTSLTYSQGGTLTFQYTNSTSGQPYTVTDGRGHTLTFGYSAIGGQSRLVSLTLPDNRNIDLAPA